MISSMQPSRPKVANQRINNPQNQHQIRSSSTPSLSSNATSTITARPQSQVEAMPQSGSPQTTRQLINPSLPWNPASMHPVFFSENWRKSPFPMPAGATGFSPVATGYVFGRSRQSIDVATKL
ncbi:hypothetical protein K431DRAFT_229400 [Polychaeton citri CBS 116435]|uniref:Uncharacterized protein n=1 Tax=Polychaeton citri CBS 116435 TaxID=1314669 RepID=A0A9P4UM09_9PEZI|nr:hypothetical protein K431DRAFT_229400 [Polychaeton citri CBS 116435]